MEIVALLLGACVVAAAPLVPGLRPAAKGLVTGGLAAVEMAKTAAAAASEQWMDLVAEAQAERTAEARAPRAPWRRSAFPCPRNKPHRTRRGEQPAVY